MKITDSPAPIVVTPVSATAVENESESSSIFQPTTLTGAPPTLVSSNQSTLYGVNVLLPHAATSDTITRAVDPADSSTTSVTARLNDVVASGVTPTAGSSTLTVML